MSISPDCGKQTTKAHKNYYLECITIPISHKQGFWSSGSRLSGGRISRYSKSCHPPTFFIQISLIYKLSTTINISCKLSMVSKVVKFIISLSSFHYWHSLTCSTTIFHNRDMQRANLHSYCVISTMTNNKDHWSDLINPKLANNDVMDCSGDFFPGVMITRLIEL